jgi:hypothetical protein
MSDYCLKLSDSSLRHLLLCFHRQFFARCFDKRNEGRMASLHDNLKAYVDDEVYDSSMKRG